MSRRAGAPYRDRIIDDGKVLIYEGHDVPRERGATAPKELDQPLRYPSGALTQNGLFSEAAERAAKENHPLELVRECMRKLNLVFAYLTASSR
jgi:hypothetical protein